jgi:uncharacterized protein YqgV (UPF0045/DUF77 family)
MILLLNTNSSSTNQESVSATTIEAVFNTVMGLAQEITEAAPEGGKRRKISNALG